MSHRATNWAFQQRHLAPAVWRVLVMLADRHNPDHGCFPSQEQLAVDCGMSRRSVNRHLETLEAVGLIRRMQVRDPATGRQRATRYILSFEDDDGQEPCARLAHGPCAKSGQSRVPTVAQEPVKEPVTTTPSVRPPSPGVEAACLDACGPGLCTEGRRAIVATNTMIGDWIAEGLDLDADVLPVLRVRTAKARTTPIRSWDYFTAAIRAARRQREAKERAAKAAASGAGASGSPDADRRSEVPPWDPVAFFAEWVNSDKYLPQSAISNRMRDELIARRLVTPERLRARGIP